MEMRMEMEMEMEMVLKVETGMGMGMVSRGKEGGLSMSHLPCVLLPKLHCLKAWMAILISRSKRALFPIVKKEE